MKKTIIAAGLTAALSSSAFATNGYFVHGVGQSAKGAGGAGIAYPQDSLAAGTNPAGMAFIGNRADGGLELFAPDRELEADGPMWSFFGLDGTEDGTEPYVFLVPEGGYNMDMPNGSAWSFGVSAFGNGGMNATYDNHPQIQAMAFDPSIPWVNPGDSTRAKIDLLQAFVMPTASYRINEDHAVGASLIVAWQSMELINAAFGTNGAGHVDSWGAGVKLGWQGRITDNVSLGATWQSKIKMSKMDEYEVPLAADDGHLDIPQSAGVGIAINATDQLDLLFDVVWINYSDESSILGIPTNEGGFGWDDMTVFKLGAVYKYSDTLTLRAGYNYGEQPLPSGSPADGFVSTLVPATVEHHLTLGFTKAINDDFSITGSYMHAFEESHTAGFDPRLAANPFLEPSDAALTSRMFQDSIGLSLNWKL